MSLPILVQSEFYIKNFVFDWKAKLERWKWNQTEIKYLPAPYDDHEFQIRINSHGIIEIYYNKPLPDAERYKLEFLNRMKTSKHKVKFHPETQSELVKPFKYRISGDFGPLGDDFKDEDGCHFLRFTLKSEDLPIMK